MNSKQFVTAIGIIAKNHSTQLFINKPLGSDAQFGNSIGNLGVTEYTIRIKDCCASVIKNLINEGYSLSMQDGLTSVNKYGTLS